jgi:hypothetical protein
MKPLFGILLSLVSAVSSYSADRVPTVFLTHFFVTLDQPTYDLLRNSTQLAALAGSTGSHVVAGSRAWTGFYLFGRETYIEFFGVSASPSGHNVGDSGLGLTVEEPGGVAAIAGRLRIAFGERVNVEATPRSLPNGVVPWFTEAEITSRGEEAMHTWFMEIDPGYLAAKHPGSRVEHPLSRQQYLSWDYRPNRPLDNVVGLTAALNPPEMSQLAKELELVGWAVSRGDGGFVAVGPDVKLTVLPAGKREGIQEAELRLQHSVPKQEITLGTAKLFLDGETGRFVFQAAD